MKKSVIIVGSGLGGLTCGVILAKNGYNVTVLEQNAQIGGCLQCFTRKGVKFETGMHFIGSVGDNQPLNGIWKYLELDKNILLSPLDTDGYDVFKIKKLKYSFPIGKKSLLEKLKIDFPHQSKQIENLWKKIDLVVNNSSIKTIGKNQIPDSEALILGDLPLDNVLNESIEDETLRNILVGNLPLYAARKDRTPFSLFAFIMDFYRNGAYRIIGGSDTIANSLCKTIESYGGRVLTHHKVEKLNSKENFAREIICDNGTSFTADEFILAIHPARFLELTDSHIIRKTYRERINNLQQSPGCFSIYLNFKKNSVPYMNFNFYSYKNNTPWDCEYYTKEEWPKGYLYMHFCNETNQKFAESGVVLSYINFNEVEDWIGSKIGQRGEKYNTFKANCAEKLLSFLEKDFPGITNNIAEYYTSTPLTYLDYTGTEYGGMYGVSKIAGGGALTRIAHRTKFSNVHLAGQNVNSHGFQGVIIGSLTVCSDIFGNSEFLTNTFQENDR